MSQLAPARPLPRTAPRRAAAPTPRQLKVVGPREGEGNGIFLSLCVVLLLGGFVGVLVLNTAMAKGSYTLRDLQHRSDELTDAQDALRHSLDAVSGPGPLAQARPGAGDGAGGDPGVPPPLGRQGARGRPQGQGGQHLPRGDRVGTPGPDGGARAGIHRARRDATESHPESLREPDGHRLAAPVHDAADHAVTDHADHAVTDHADHAHPDRHPTP